MTHLVRQIYYPSCLLYLSRMDICRHYCKYSCMARKYQLECLGHFSCYLDYDDDYSSYSPGYDDAPQAPRYIFQSRDSLGTLWHHVEEALSRPYSIWEYCNNHTSLYGVSCRSDYDKGFYQKIKIYTIISNPSSPTIPQCSSWTPIPPSCIQIACLPVSNIWRVENPTIGSIAIYIQVFNLSPFPGLPKL